LTYSIQFLTELGGTASPATPSIRSETAIPIEGEFERVTVFIDGDAAGNPLILFVLVTQ
jgi:hypothetical protein